MNIFRNLIGRVWHDPNAAEVVKINSGQLYLIRPGNIRSSRECIYNEAMATIRRIPSMEHHFQLVITRVYEDGDQELIEDEDETDEERAFLIGEELEFRTGETDGESTLIWRDLDGDVDELYEFVTTDMNAPTKAFFETCMYQAMYERKYRATSDGIPDADLEQFIWRTPTAKPKVKKTKKGTKDDKDTVALSSAMQSLTVDNASPMKDVKVSTPAKPRQAPAPSPDAPEIVSTPAQLYWWDFEKGEFNFQADVTASIVHTPGAEFTHWLVARTSDGQLLAHGISPDLNQRWSNNVHSLTWNHEDVHGQQRSWLFRFASDDDYGKFLYSFNSTSWEGSNRLQWDKATPDEREYVMSSVYNDDVEMADAEEEEGEEDAVVSELDPEEEQTISSESEDEDGRPPALKPGERNSRLTVGYKGDRSYVVRGNNIGVFNTKKNQVKYYATISKIATPKGKEFIPSQVMLHDQDTKMVLLNPKDPNSLYNMDIERGKVVEEWKVHDSIAVETIAPDNKFAQTTTEKTLIGASHNALFRIDPRMSGNKLVDSQYKQYVSRNAFSGLATTESGKIAVASKKGDIRLFDTVGKNARTALPPLGDPILGIDVTANGRWIVATTKTYLLLINTLIGEGRYQGKLGFDRSFPANARPVPKRLQLRSDHVAYMNHAVSFTPAKFNQGEGQEENAIITSTGPFVVAWDFAKVKKGLLDKYEIKKYEDLVVQDSFRFGDDKEIIVALQNNVLAINKKNLRKPTRKSLAAPVGPRQSSSNIVNSPF